MKYYFTFGSDDKSHPYNSGWVEVEAPSMSCAKKVFMDIYPCESGLPYAGLYTEMDFQRTRMYREGNFGHGCWEKIIIRRKFHFDTIGGVTDGTVRA